MILKIFLVSTGGIGHIFNIKEENSIKDENDILTSGFFIAIRSFGRSIYQELQYIQFVRSRVCFLPSQEKYVLCVHATNDYSANDLLFFLEDIRDDINTELWDEIQNQEFFCNSSTLKKYITPFIQKAMKNRRWN